ncbi:ferrous iron transport protein B [Kribbella sp. VKM Ac-2527]|uniref:Ferrous iron transport protein B n=1 Tax=Kribbella caucasensis TaxID=2512215 RepID=A0A4R6KB89_9ACTN|nr:ferrous iron transporter B [Kribbella sp. VKM Ac-2527]TDO46688.1 ferrous iron transport protein B [Kribbella sp. VKM Ac-2527]
MSHDCGSCALNPQRLEVVAGGYDYVVAVAGNPNTGKSTVFNALTGLRQRSGNWPGTTVTRAEGGYRFNGHGYKVVDLPGVYSLRSATGEEDVARDFLQHGTPDVTVVVVDATRLERNLNLVLQILQVTDKVVVALNLVDEAERHGITVDTRHLARELGVPVTATAARRGRGITELQESIDLVARGKVASRGRRLRLDDLSEDEVVVAFFAEAGRIARSSITVDGRARLTVDRMLDRALTHRVWGFVVMGLLFFGVFWFTITGAAVPSDFLYRLLVQDGHVLVRELLSGAPWWITGLVADGIYLGTAWVIAVMLPPMAIFFPLFTLLEDFGYLPRVAFNLDRLFASAGAHGKQSLSMMMGYGCNAAGVTATRIIDSPRERMIAIVTNNFSICNGRWPTLILMGTVFIGTLVPPALAGLVAAGSVVLVAVLGIVTTLVVSWGLSKTVLRGATSVYSLELPPYRPPQVLRTIYTSVIDRTLKVLWRAIVMAAPAGAVIWLIGNVSVDGSSIAAHVSHGLDPLGLALGLNGIILLAYLVAIPANEIIIPTILMLTMTLGPIQYGVSSGVMLELADTETGSVLVQAGGWTVLTAINLMLFSMLHNPCSTTILTIWKETRSLKWTTTATLLPLALAFGVTFATAGLARLAGWA